MNNKQYLRLGNKLVEITEIEGGIPKLKTTSEEIKKEDGSVDVVVRVPYLKIESKEGLK